MRRYIINHVVSTNEQTPHLAYCTNEDINNMYVPCLHCLYLMRWVYNPWQVPALLTCDWGNFVPSKVPSKIYGVRGRLVWDDSETVSSFNRWTFGERRTTRATHPQFEAEFSSIHRSTLTSSTSSSDDALASIFRSQVAFVWGRRLRARQAQG